MFEHFYFNRKRSINVVPGQKKIIKEFAIRAAPFNDAVANDNGTVPADQALRAGRSRPTDAPDAAGLNQGGKGERDAVRQPWAGQLYGTQTPKSVH